MVADDNRSSAYGFSAGGTSKSSSCYDDQMSSDMRSLNASSYNDLGEIIDDLAGNSEEIDEET